MTFDPRSTTFRIDHSTEIPLSDLTSGILADSLAYWRDVKGDTLAPSWADFEIMGMPVEAIPFTTVVDVIGDTPKAEFVYRFWGSGHVRAKGIDRTDRSVRVHPQGRGLVVHDEYRRVAEDKRAIAFRRAIVLPRDKPALMQTAVRMPLSSDGTTIDKIVAVSDWLSHKRSWNDLNLNPDGGSRGSF